jgi:hypothetical protein
LSASHSTVCRLAWKRCSRQTPRRDVVPALNGRASLARVRPCRTDAASFMEARARGRARRRASSAAGGQIGNTGTIRGKPRRNGRACERHYLRSAICATRSKGFCTAVAREHVQLIAFLVAAVSGPCKPMRLGYLADPLPSSWRRSPMRVREAPPQVGLGRGSRVGCPAQALTDLDDTKRPRPFARQD